MNFPCGQCVYFDQQKKNNAKGIPVDKWFGFCAKASVYQEREQEGQVFPEGVTRANDERKVKLVVVQPGETRSSCHEGVRR